MGQLDPVYLIDLVGSDCFVQKLLTATVENGEGGEGGGVFTGLKPDLCINDSVL